MRAFWAAPLLIVLAVSCSSGGDEGSSGNAGDPSLILAGDNYFEYMGKRTPTISVRAGTEATFRITNTGKAIHNLRVAGSDRKYGSDDDFVSTPISIEGGREGTISFRLSETGKTNFRCDFHPDQKGTFSIVPN